MEQVINSSTNWFYRRALISARSDSDFYHQCKRLIDFSIALLALTLLAPFMILVAILIRLDSAGPALFVQERVGARRKIKDGQPIWEIQSFPFYKFRTMRTDVDAELHQKYMKAYIAGDEAQIANLEPGLKSSTSYKLSGDPRVTKIGKFLRSTSLDELPQLWNVLIGDMSIVGPRPPIPYEVEMYSQKHLLRLAATPGITGLWQVSGRCETTFEEMVNLDLEYIEKQSFWLDLKILLLTLPAVISEKGAG